MTKRWISDARQRASKKYKAVHRDLALSRAAQEQRKANRSQSDKQIRHETQAEMFRRYADSFC